MKMSNDSIFILMKSEVRSLTPLLDSRYPRSAKAKNRRSQGTAPFIDLILGHLRSLNRGSFLKAKIPILEFDSV
jgi:hypothetical protein